MAARRTATRRCPPSEIGRPADDDRRSSSSALHRVGVGDAGRVRGRAACSTAERHPDADRLTRVHGRRRRRASRSTIVCGAPNVAAGQTVAVALPGRDHARRHEARRGEAARRRVERDDPGRGRGRASARTTPGSWCWTTTLPVGRAAGRAPADRRRGARARDHAQPARRAGGLRRGARAARGHRRRRWPRTRPADDAEPAGDDRAEDHASVEIDPEICLRFTARVFEDVKIGPSPLWLKQRLMAAGQRPISNVVDITNYVMLAHRPAAARVRPRRGARAAGSSCARAARGRDDDHARRRRSARSTPSMALVCDAEGPSGDRRRDGRADLRGVRQDHARADGGGHLGRAEHHARPRRRSGCAPRRRARFEKQLHPELAMAAQRLAARLMVELCGARLVPGHDRRVPAARREPRVVPLRARADGEAARRAHRRRRASTAILERLGFELEAATERLDGRRCRYWRDGDVQREADLIEEVARIHGLDKLPTTLPARRRGRRAADARASALRRRLEDAAARPRPDRDDLVQLHLAARRSRGCGSRTSTPLRLENPLSEDQSVMRPLLLPGLLDAARHNTAHGRAGRGAVRVRARLPAGRAAGAGARRVTRRRDARRRAPPPRRAASPRRRPAGWRTPAARRRLLRREGAAGGGARGGRHRGWRVDEPGERPFLHPGRRRRPVARPATGAQARLDRRAAPARGRASGSFTGRWPPSSSTPDCCHELTAGRIATYRDVTSFPAVLQDIAVVVPEDAPAAAARRGACAAGARRAARAASGCSTSTAASRWGRATSRWPCGSSSARPTARSPTRRSPSAAPRSRASSSRSEAGSVPDRDRRVAGASAPAGLSRARSAPRSCSGIRRSS